MSETLTQTGPLWRWQAEAGGSWHFLTVDGDGAHQVAAHEAQRRLELGRARGSGSVKVRARCGASEWQTSLFPSKEHAGYLLPVKKSVRTAEGVAAGDEMTVHLTLV
ncbi:DUF1905 domain-containing protein [Paraurantiacibacter namhicola]|uniref:DUF1905 domain-containing protein n=1 Tax=Paraurantiacibacter namhicola TaxID=645517 RepID=A0A1C7D770_9SPHN|nr:DUF1905 domain-containing protein [Paraurantiacibacter namhicola]ANU07324.1 hypothetical protein A6F65_01014 [Paraurantiacibacter namhicola]